MNILVVDDEKIILEGIIRLLKQYPHAGHVRGATDGFSALDILKAEKYDIVITDIRMPEMDGLELIRQARELGLCDTFIILTGYADFGYAKKAISCGVSEYILKPVDMEELGEALGKIYIRKTDPAAEKSREFRLEHAIREINGSRRPQSLQVKALFLLMLEYPEWKDEMKHFLEGEEICIRDAVAGQLYHALLVWLECSGASEVAAKALLMIIRDSREASFSLNIVADRLYINSNYLSGMITGCIGISAYNFIRILRVSAAQEMLLDAAGYSTWEISEKCGFGNSNAFYRTFKDIAGMTPKNYKERGL